MTSPDQITPREHQVVRAVCAGYKGKEVASLLGISPSTVKSHMRSVFWKLGIHSRVQLVTWAAGNGLVTLE